MKESIEISTDKNLLDIDFIHSFITESYWAKGRTLSAMKTCIDNSLNFGVYIQNKQGWETIKKMFFFESTEL